MSKHKIEAVTVQVINWAKHNTKQKKGHGCFMLSKDFFDDDKIARCTVSECTLFIYLLTRCAKEMRDTVTIVPRVMPYSDSTRPILTRDSILRLEQFQLVRVINIAYKTPLHYITSHDRTEQNVTSQDRDSAAASPAPAQAELLPKEKPKPKNADAQSLIAAYCDLWKAKHGRNEKSPPITGKDSGIIARLLKSISREKLDLYLKAYFAMPDAWVTKSTHPLELFERNLKEIAAFSESGRFITRRDAQQAEDRAFVTSQLARIDKGEV